MSDDFLAQNSGDSSKDPRIRSMERQIESIRIINAAFSNDTPHNVAKRALVLILGIIKASAGTIYVYDPDRHMLRFEIVHGEAAATLHGKYLSVDQGVAGYVFRNREEVITNDINTLSSFDPSFDRKTKFPTFRMIAVPLLGRNGNTIGVIQALNGYSNFKEEDLPVVRILAMQAALAIDMAGDGELRRLAAVAEAVGAQSHQVKNFLQRFYELSSCQEGVTKIQALITTLSDDSADKTAAFSEIRRELVSLELGLNSLATVSQRLERRMLGVTNMVKDGTLPEPEFATRDIRDVFSEVGRELNGSYVEAGVSLSLQSASDVPQFVFDYEMLFDMVFNLVHNALPHTSSGGGVMVEAIHKDGGVVISVADTGKGMTEQILDRLISGKAISTTKGGSGLGFQIALEVVKVHKGKLTEATSRPGEGTKFSFWLPVSSLQSPV